MAKRISTEDIDFTKLPKGKELLEIAKLIEAYNLEFSGADTKPMWGDVAVETCAHLSYSLGISFADLMTGAGDSISMHIAFALRFGWFMGKYPEKLAELRKSMIDRYGSVPSHIMVDDGSGDEVTEE